MELVVAIDGVEWTRVRARELGARAWILGVVAVQLTVDDGHVGALVRASLTGTPPVTRPLARDAIVQVALVEEGAHPDWPAAPAPPLGHDVAAIHCLTAGVHATLARAQLADDPPRRAFAHVYCRWLRDGTVEPGYDLTDFLSKPPGEMYERKLHHPLAAGQIVTYAVSVAS